MNDFFNKLAILRNNGQTTGPNYYRYDVITDEDQQELRKTFEGFLFNSLLLEGKDPAADNNVTALNYQALLYTGMWINFFAIGVTGIELDSYLTDSQKLTKIQYETIDYLFKNYKLHYMNLNNSWKSLNLTFDPTLNNLAVTGKILGNMQEIIDDNTMNKLTFMKMLDRYMHKIPTKNFIEYIQNYNNASAARSSYLSLRDELNNKLTSEEEELDLEALAERDYECEDQLISLPIYKLCIQLRIPEIEAFVAYRNKEDIKGYNKIRPSYEWGELESKLINLLA